VVEEPVALEEPSTQGTVVGAPVTDDPVAEGPSIEKSTQAAEPIVDEPVVEDPVPGSPAVAESVPELPVPLEPATEVPAADNDSVNHEPEAPAAVDDAPLVEETESAPELGQVSPPVVGEVETTVHHEVPIIEDITSAPTAETTPTEEPTGVTEPAQPSEHVESEPEPEHTGNGGSIEETKETSDEALPADAVQASAPVPVESTAESAPDEDQTS